MLKSAESVGLYAFIAVADELSGIPSKLALYQRSQHEFN
jgi:hypothetical protein